MFIVFALTQTLGVGTVALVSHAVGRKDREEANHVFNQSVSLAAVCALLTLVAGYGLAGPYMQFFGADAATMAAGEKFLDAFIPGLALQFALVVMGSGLRGTGIVKSTMVVQALTVALNAALAPVLIAGWGDGVPSASRSGPRDRAVGRGGRRPDDGPLPAPEKYVGFDVSQWRPRVAT